MMPRYLKYLKRACITTAVVGAAYTGYWYTVDRQHDALHAQRFMRVAQADMENLNIRPKTPLPSRDELLNSLDVKQFDVLVIGGGATGAGVAVDSQTRGLETALVELNDFASGTSSKSTKLIHGGVRYLQAAFFKLDIEQYRMVKEALFERGNLLQVAPHLTQALPIMLPVYKWWQVPYFWAGIKMYDLVAGRKGLKSSYFISKKKALELFPMLKKDSLVGALVYYDGQQNDARTNVALIISAIRKGAKCVNYCAATSLIKEKDENGIERIVGACVKDQLTGKERTIRAKCVVNAAGPFTDGIRRMDNPDIESICVPSQGVHITLPGYYSPPNMGLLDPATSDGRVIFFLPWEKYTVAGTTDNPTDVTYNPAPTEKEVDFIFDEVKHYLSDEISVRRGDIVSAWAGLRPLVRDPNKKDTKSLARNHIIEVSDTKLITIAGGKWTTYRHMAEETVDTAIKECGLTPIRPCATAGLMLEGAHDWSPLLYINLVQDYGIDVEVAEHLVANYGDRAFSVAKMATVTGKRYPLVGKRLHEEFPYLEAEVRYAIREYACTAVDVIGRRLRIAFLNSYAAEECLPRVLEIMAKELNWDRKEMERQKQLAQDYLNIEMGKIGRSRALEMTTISLTKLEQEAAIRRFNDIDSGGKGVITVNNLRDFFKNKGEKIDERLLHEILNEVDLNKNGEVDLMEFLQLWSGLKLGHVTHSRFAALTLTEDDTSKLQFKSPALNRASGDA